MGQYNSVEELYHSGVLGMKWGHHKQKTKFNPKYNKSDTASDKYLYGNNGQKRIESKMNAGGTRLSAVGHECVRDTLISLGTTAVLADMATGGAIHRDVSRGVGQAFVKAYLKSKDSKAAKAAAKAVAKSVIQIAKNKKFDPIDVAYKILN